MRCSGSGAVMVCPCRACGDGDDDHVAAGSASDGDDRGLHVSVVVYSGIKYGRRLSRSLDVYSEPVPLQSPLQYLPLKRKKRCDAACCEN